MSSNASGGHAYRTGGVSVTVPGTVPLSAAKKRPRRTSLEPHQKAALARHEARELVREARLKRTVFFTAVVVVLAFTVAVVLMVLFKPGAASHDVCDDCDPGCTSRRPP